jgi:hypothetical protein
VEFRVVPNFTFVLLINSYHVWLKDKIAIHAAQSLNSDNRLFEQVEHFKEWDVIDID